MSDVKYNMWIPTTSPKELKILGKLAEEVNELGACIGRCIVQGIIEDEPVTGKPNRLWLEDEIADVEVNLKLVKEFYGLDIDYINKRALNKEPKLREWQEYE